MNETERRKSQSELILEAMLNGRRLTCIDILREMACMNAKGRLHELRRAGNAIKDEWVTTQNGARVKRYFMDVPADERQLRLIA